MAIPAYDGGNAFPCEQHETAEGTWNQTFDPGMTLRDYFAAKALQGIVGAAAFNQAAEDMMKKAGINVASDTEKFIAHIAYSFADAMLAERGEPLATKEAR